MPKILLTGGMGYIGSHTYCELVYRKYDVVIVDNLQNSQVEVAKRLEMITGRKVTFHIADLCDREAMDRIFRQHKFDAVIHFAGLKAVGESVAQPWRYYTNNVIGTLNLLGLMNDYGVKKIVFSSSATVYGRPESLPLTESMPVSSTNPYGATKVMIEQILRDMAQADRSFCAVALRYFNPIGAHDSGLIGESPNGTPNNIAPYIMQVAVGKLPCIYVYGSDYDTVDGTGVRDYIHINDLALGHIAALERVVERGFFVYNLGTGRGTSVLQLLAAFERACGKSILHKFCPRRDGDVAASYADVGLAFRELGWKSMRSIDDMCESLWKWQTLNPDGYRSPVKK